MIKKYKPSMFNYLLHDGNEMVLYNSFQGSKSIVRIGKENKEKVLQWTNSNEIIIDNDTLFSALCEKGFFVSKLKDEKAERDFFYLNYVDDNTLRLVVHTTTACNFRCKYCSLNFSEHSMPESIQNGIVNLIKKKLNSFNRLEINWFGGEPLLGMNVIENISKRVIEICKRAKKMYYASITTNGYLLTEKNIKKLIECKVMHYTVTVDGTKEIHDSLRVLIDGHPTYERIINNLLFMKQYVKNSNLRVFIRTNMTKKITLFLDEYYCTFNSLFGDDNRFSLFLRAVVDAGGDRIDEVRDDLLTKDDTNTLINRISKHQKNGNISFDQNLSFLEPGGYCCVAMRNGKFTIDVFGGVYKCDVLDDKTKIGVLSDNGNIIPSEVSEASWMSTIWSNKPECDNCFLSAVCFKGVCPMQEIVNHSSSCIKQKKYSELDCLIKLYESKNQLQVL